MIIVSNSGPIANYLVDEASGERKKSGQRGLHESTQSLWIAFKL